MNNFKICCMYIGTIWMNINMYIFYFLFTIDKLRHLQVPQKVYIYWGTRKSAPKIYIYWGI
jgi:hypothetical protein